MRSGNVTSASWFPRARAYTWTVDRSSWAANTCVSLTARQLRGTELFLKVFGVEWLGWRVCSYMPASLAMAVLLANGGPETDEK